MKMLDLSPVQMKIAQVCHVMGNQEQAEKQINQMQLKFKKVSKISNDRPRPKKN